MENMSEVKSAKIEVVRPTVKTEIEPTLLPLPLQVITRGIQSVASKFADGADLEVIHTEDVFEARTLKRRLLLEYNKESGKMKVLFEKYGEGRFFVKCAFIECNTETAKDILHYTRVMFCDAIDTLVVKVPDSLLSLFGVKAEAEAETQTA